MFLTPSEAFLVDGVRTDQCFVVDLLSDEFVLAERVSGLSGDGVYRPFLHLLLYSTIQHEERLTCTLLDTDNRDLRITHERTLNARVDIYIAESVLKQNLIPPITHAHTPSDSRRSWNKPIHVLASKSGQMNPSFSPFHLWKVAFSV